MEKNCPLLTARELAEVLGISEEAVRRYTQQTRIPFVEVGSGQYRYELAAVMRSLEDQSGTVEENAPSYGKEGTYTYKDYLQLPEEPGFRFEVLDGCLVKEPSPTVQHQYTLGSLYRILVKFFATADPGGIVFVAPLDVTLSEYTVVQPDLLYIPSNRLDILTETRVDGAPALVIEILSPTNRGKDRVEKMEIYRKAGILHYWIVDPEDCRLDAFCLRDGDYELAAAANDGQDFTHPDFPGLVIPLQIICRFPGRSTTSQ